MASRFGIQPQLIDDTLYDAFGQRQVTQYFTQVNTYEVIEEITPALQADPATLSKIYIRAPTNGQMVPLERVRQMDDRSGRAAVDQPPGTVPRGDDQLQPRAGRGARPGDSGDPEGGAGIADAAGADRRRSRATPRRSRTSLTTVPLLILAALVVVYLILGMLYESFIHPLTILSTLPSAGFGALAMLMLNGYEFSLIALIGTILLIGIVKKNGIMMVDFAIVAQHEGLSPVEAIRKAALLRFRPIMMTTMAALLGGVPLMFSHGTGSELRQPLGYAMVGGLAVSQALTLFTTPVIYIYLERLQQWLTGKRPRTVVVQEAPVEVAVEAPWSEQPAE